MFEGAMGKASGPKGRVWIGAGISVSLHAGLLLGAVWLTSGGGVKPAEPPDFKPVVIDFTKVAKGTPAGEAPRPAAQPKPRPRRKEVKAPVTVSRPVEVEPVPALDPEPAFGADPVAGDPIGEAGAGPRGDERGSCEGPGCLTEAPAYSGVQEYRGGEMTPPVLLAGTAPEYTREALEARVEGTMIVKCVITREGLVNQCRVIKGLPHLEQEVLSSLGTRRYKPVTVDGQPIDVSYVLNIRVRLPR